MNRTTAEQIEEAATTFQKGDLARAEAIYRRLIVELPLNSAVYNSLGTVLDCQTVW